MGERDHFDLDERLSHFDPSAAGRENHRLADALLNAGRTDDAERVLSEAMAERAADAELLLLDARRRAQVGDLLGARAALTHAARLAPDDAQPLCQLGELLLRQRDPNRALIVLRRAEGITPYHPEVRRLIAAAIAAGAESPEETAVVNEMEEPEAPIFEDRHTDPEPWPPLPSEPPAVGALPSTPPRSNPPFDAKEIELSEPELDAADLKLPPPPLALDEEDASLHESRRPQKSGVRPLLAIALFATVATAAGFAIALGLGRNGLGFGGGNDSSSELAAAVDGAQAELGAGEGVDVHRMLEDGRGRFTTAEGGGPAFELMEEVKEQAPAETLASVEEALGANGEDEGLRYVAGRLLLRLGELARAEETLEELETPSAFVARGEIAYELGDQAGCVARAEEALLRNPGALDADLLRTVCDRGRGDVPALPSHASARERILWTLARLEQDADDPIAAGWLSDPELGEANLLLARATALLAQGDLARAHADFERAANASTAGSRILKLANARLAAWDVDGAQQALDDAAQRESDECALAIVRARRALIAADGENAARTQLERANCQEPLTIDAQALGLRLGRMSRRERLRQSQELYAEHEGNALVALGFAEAALAAGQVSDALQAITVARSQPETRTEALFLQGRAHEALGEARSAERLYRDALRRAPNSERLQLAMATLLLNRGQCAEAADRFAQLGVSQGDDLRDTHTLGWALALSCKGEAEAAAARLATLASERAMTPAARTAAARIDRALGHLPQGIERLVSWTDEGDIPPEAWALLGELELATGDERAAANAFRHAIARDSDLPEALAGRAELSLRDDDYDAAEDRLRRLARSLHSHIRPPQMQARLRFMQGRLALARGNTESAQHSLEAALRSDPALCEAHYYLSRMSLRSNPEASRAAMQRYLDACPHGRFARQ